MDKNPKDLPKLALHLRILRRTRGISQPQISKATGIAVTTLSSWEMGHSVPSLDSARKLAAFYGISIGELLDPK